MRLAEALLLRGDTQKYLAALRERIVQNSLVQEGSEPYEDPERLLAEAQGVVGRLEVLVVGINEANMKNRLADGMTLTEALARRDSLQQQHSVIVAAVRAAGDATPRYGAREIRWVAKVDVPRLQQQLQDLSRQIRELNAQIQEVNWRVEV